MIQANELRRGNLLQDVIKLEKALIVYKIESDVIVCGDEDFNYPYLAETLDPIPLTPEILEKNCGFGYIKVDGVSRLSDDFDDFEELQKEFTHNWTLNVKASEHNDSFHFEIVKWGEQEYFTFAHQWLRIRIKFVHQLQNLYFALTGQELTITL